jgi:hypothetical protein
MYLETFYVISTCALESPCNSLGTMLLLVINEIIFPYAHPVYFSASVQLWHLLPIALLFIVSNNYAV